tara:strand:- start:196 stop:366 length:171 start_codon:yes stop_codon:yes gene_type:complete
MIELLFWMSQESLSKELKEYTVWIRLNLFFLIACVKSFNSKKLVAQLIEACYIYCK